MNITRREFIKSLALTAGSLAISGCGATAIKTAADKLSSLGTLDSTIEYTRQIVAADNSTGRTIMWQTKPGAFTKEVSVLLRDTASHKEISFPARSESFTDDGETHDIYTSIL